MSGKRRGEAAHEREWERDYELNVDLSSAGCRSKEQHWQAEHRIHRSLLSMPSSSFSEVEEHRGAWLQARNVHICCFLCVCFFGGGVEVWAHAQCLKAKIWHFENVTRIPKHTHKKKKNRKRKEKVWWTNTYALGGVGFREGRIIFSEWEIGKNKNNGTKTDRYSLSWQYTSAASVYNCWVGSRTHLNYTLQRFISAFFFLLLILL